MADFFSEAWVAEYAAAGAQLPELAGADLVIQYVVSDAPDGKVRWFEVIEAGRVTSAEVGKHKTPAVTITWKAPVALSVLGGDISGDASFMQGRAKVEGDYVRWLLDLREWRTSAAVTAMHAAAAETV